MSVNVFGLSGNKTKSAVTKRDLDSKFINVTKNLQLKVDKSGGSISGNLNMSDHKITDLADPISDKDASNKKFVKSEIKADSVLTKLYIDTLLHTKLDKNITEDLNMNGQKISGLVNPTNDDEVCNKKYLDLKIKQESTSTKLNIDSLFNNIENRLNLFDIHSILNLQKDDITAENIFYIGSDINNLLKEKDINIEQFSKRFQLVEKMYKKYLEIFEIVGDASGNIPDILKSYIFDLKIAIIKVIEDLPRNIFIELKTELVESGLISTPEAKTLRKRYRRFINGLSKIIDPTRSNEELELLIQKNLLLIDLGYVYFMENLLERLLAGS